MQIDSGKQFSIKDQIPWKKRFFTLFTGQAFSLLGSQLVQFALIWYLTQETKSATVLATASMIGMLPQVFLSPFAGALVDRFKRRTILILADASIAFATLILAVLFHFQIVQIWHIYILLFVRAIGGGFHGPAMVASTSLMVPVEHLTRIQGINQMLNGGLNIVAAPLGAILIESFPLQAILAIDVVTALIAITPLFFFTIPQPLRDPQIKTTILQDMQIGFRFIFRWPGMLILLLMVAMINFLMSPSFSLLPLLVTEHFSKGALELGWLEAGLGVGTILGGLALGVWGGFNKRILTSMLGLVGIGISVSMLGLLPANGIYIAVAVMVSVGIFFPITNGPIGAIIQALVPADMQGRVFTVLGSLATGITPIGLALAGPLADRFGIQIWFVITGVLTFGMGIIGFSLPLINNLENSRREPQAAD